MPKLKVGVVLMGAYFVMCGQAAAFTKSEYMQGSPEFQQGYVFGLMEYMSGVASKADPSANKRTEGYRRCFVENKISSLEGLDIVTRYLQRAPDASTVPMLSNVLRAFHEACARYVD